MTTKKKRKPDGSLFCSQKKIAANIAAGVGIRKPYELVDNNKKRLFEVSSSPLPQPYERKERNLANIWNSTNMIGWGAIPPCKMYQSFCILCMPSPAKQMRFDLNKK